MRKDGILVILEKSDFRGVKKIEDIAALDFEAAYALLDAETLEIKHFAICSGECGITKEHWIMEQPGK